MVTKWALTAIYGGACNHIGLIALGGLASLGRVASGAMSKFILLFIMVILNFSNAHAACLYPVEINHENIYDGDTAMKTIITMPFGITKQTTLRLIEIDAPEMHGETKGAATVARDWLRQEVKKCKSLAVSLFGVDSFGRSLAKLYCGHKNLNLEMLKLGLVRKYQK